MTFHIWRLPDGEICFTESAASVDGWGDDCEHIGTTTLPVTYEYEPPK